MDLDVFISHASEDKSSFVRPLAAALVRKGLRVWYDEYSLHVGDSIRRCIELGLQSSRYGIVIISPAFLEKEWPQKELDYLFTAETVDGHKILPVWHNVTFLEVHSKLPLISDRLATRSSLGLEQVVADIMRAIQYRNTDPSGPPNTISNRKQTTDGKSEYKQIIQDLYDLLLSPIQEVSTDSSNIKLLIVDDDIVGEVLSVSFREEGFSTVWVQDGVEAVEQLSRSPFDIVISDIMMPRMNGEDLTRTLSQKYPDLPVILISGYSSGTEAHIVELSHVAFIQKPFDTKRIEEAIGNIVGDNRLYQFSKKTFLDGFRTYRNLANCHSVIHTFLQIYQSNDLFETAIRHKIKDSVRDFCKDVCADISKSYDLSCQLLSRLMRLDTLMSQIRHGSQTGLIKILKGIKEDIESEHPGVNVELSAMNRLPPFIAGSDIETFLAFSVLELTDNALDAMENKGQLKISLRKKQTSNSLALGVWNDGPNIGPELAEKIFNDAITTKGPGRGMGLNIVKNLCVRFGGNVKLAQGPGVQFTVFIPLETKSTTRERTKR